MIYIPLDATGMKPISLLHLSDIHFGAQSAFQDDAKSSTDASARNTAFRNLSHLLSECLASEQLDSIIFSGDITNLGNRKGFEEFLESCLNPISGLVRDNRSICVVPGNHDVKWGLDPNLPDYFDQKFSAYAEFVKRLGATTSLIPTGKFDSSLYADIKFSSDLPGPLYVDDSRRFIVLCINSSVRCGEVNTSLRSSFSSPIENARKHIVAARNKCSLDDQMSLNLSAAEDDLNNLGKTILENTLFDIPHITQTQLNKVCTILNRKKDELGNDNWDEYVKIGVLHHHVIPFEYQKPEYKPFELIVDAAAVLHTLGSYGFQVVLTGHKHQPYVQPVRLKDFDMVVSGGMTVGGYPVGGSKQGIRHLHIEREDDRTLIRIADLPCDWLGDLRSEVHNQIRTAKTYVVQHSNPKRRWNFPRQIEVAVEAQIFERKFYKENVRFEVEISELEGDQLQFETILTYDVINLSPEPQEWRTEYTYTISTGTPLEIRFNSELFEPGDRGIQSGRGISAPYTLDGNQRGHAHIRVREIFPYQGAVRYTSFAPATDLSIKITKNAPRFDFDAEVLYHKRPKREQADNILEVNFDEGLLPYQGLQLNWGLKEKKSES